MLAVFRGLLLSEKVQGTILGTYKCSVKENVYRSDNNEIKCLSD